jgi:putative ribosome biogenesis GTPase RsgA
MKQLSPAIAFIPSQEEAPPQFRPLTDFVLVILVGLTGVGKSTIIAALQERLDFTLLPNRRNITDEIIITSLQEEDG